MCIIVFLKIELNLCRLDFSACIKQCNYFSTCSLGCCWLLCHGKALHYLFWLIASLLPKGRFIAPFLPAPFPPFQWLAIPLLSCSSHSLLPIPALLYLWKLLSCYSYFNQYWNILFQLSKYQFSILIHCAWKKTSAILRTYWCTKVKWIS